MEIRVCERKRSGVAWKEAIYLKEVFGPRMGIPIVKVGVREVDVVDQDQAGRVRRMHGVFVTVPDEYVAERMGDGSAIVASWASARA